MDGSRDKTIGWNGLVSAGPNLGYLGPGAVRILKANGGAAEALFSGDTNRIAFAFDPEGKTVVAGGSTGNIEIYGTAGSPAPRVIPFPFHVVNALALSPDGRQIVAGDFDGKLSILDVASGKPVIAFPGDQTQMLGLSFRADGKLETVISADNQVPIESLPGCTLMARRVNTRGLLPGRRRGAIPECE